MGDRRSAIMGAGCALLVALAYEGAVAAEDSVPVATVVNPAVITATPAPAADQGVASQSPRVIISVTGFRPPREGAVQAVVQIRRDGTAQEIGRFGIFPNAEFTAADPSKAQRFGLPLPKELAGGGAIKLNVYLVPFKGEGSGALLEIGGAEIR
ncbi:MAG: hypothetical protein ACRED2_08500 [Methylocella sp.]